MNLKIKNLDKYTKLAIVIIIIGIILRFSLVSIYHIAGDSCWHISNSVFIAENNGLPLFEQFGRDEPFWPPPLFHIVSAFVYGLFLNFGKGIADFMVKMVSPLLGSLTLILLFLTAKELFNKKIALFSLIFLTFTPLHIDYSVFSYVDGTITFLAMLSVYLALRNKIIPSAIIAGLAILTKYNGIFILPILLFIIYLKNKGKKSLLKNVLMISIIPIAIGSIWFIRNWIYLGNPVWPFMNTLFNGIEIGTFAESEVGKINVFNLFNISGISAIYLAIFGVPNGDISTLSFFNIPYLIPLLIIWIIGTLIFLIPLFMGIISKKLNYKYLLYIWVGSYLILIMFYIVNASWSVARFMLPAFPALALIWGYGLQKIKFQNLKKVLIVLIILIIVGFSFTSFVKIGLAAKAWNSYSADFDWVKANTGKNEKFLTGSQCLSYNIERQTVGKKISNLDNADYIFVNQNFNLDRNVVLSKDMIQEVERGNNELVYENEETDTKIYKITK